MRSGQFRGFFSVGDDISISAANFSDFSVLPSYHLLLTAQAVGLNFSFQQQQHSEPSLDLYFFPSLASANRILILEIAGPS